MLSVLDKHETDGISCPDSGFGVSSVKFSSSATRDNVG